MTTRQAPQNPSSGFSLVVWLLPVAVVLTSLAFFFVARGDWLSSDTALSACTGWLGSSAPGVLWLALAPIVAGGFGLGFFTFAGRDLRGAVRVRGLFTCLMGLALCASSLESFSERARGYRNACSGVVLPSAGIARV